MPLAGPRHSSRNATQARCSWASSHRGSHVGAQVSLGLYSDFENYTTFRPGPQHEAIVGTMLTQVVAWANALRPLR